MCALCKYSLESLHNNLTLFQTAFDNQFFFIVAAIGHDSRLHDAWVAGYRDRVISLLHSS